MGGSFESCLYFSNTFSAHQEKMKQIETERVRIGVHFVAFVDLLGQQNKVKNICLPDYNNEKKKKQLETALHESYGVVRSMRKYFQERFEHQDNKQLQRTFDDPKLQKEWRKAAKHKIITRNISDSTIISIAFSTRSKSIPLLSVYNVISSITTTFLYSLANGHPLRAGIEIGVGIRIGGREVYGPVLSHAYNLEAKFAGYPRIVVGDELIGLLIQLQQQKPVDAKEEIEKLLATACLKLIMRDNLGLGMIDFLGKGFKDFADTTLEEYPINDIVSKSYDYVCSCVERYQNENNSKLIGRYKELKKYFDDHLDIWGLEKK